jgi:hypothetical protein
MSATGSRDRRCARGRRGLPCVYNLRASDPFPQRVHYAFSTRLWALSVYGSPSRAAPGTDVSMSSVRPAAVTLLSVGSGSRVSALSSAGSEEQSVCSLRPAAVTMSSAGSAGSGPEPECLLPAGSEEQSVCSRKSRVSALQYWLTLWVTTGQYTSTFVGWDVYNSGNTPAKIWNNGYPLNALPETFQLAGVPEPNTLAIWSLLGTLGFGVGWWRRRKAA